jgi:hypothetical protein
LIYLVVYQREKKVWIALFLFPLLCLSGVFIYLHYFHNISFSGIINEAMRGMRKEIFMGKVLSLFIGMGTITLFINPLLLINGPDRRIKLTNLYILLFSFVSSTAFVLSINYSFLQSLWLIVLATSGVSFVTRATLVIFEPKDEGQKMVITLLLAWLYVVIAYNIFFAPFGALRYMLPALMPCIVMSMLLIGKARLKALYISSVLTVMLGVAVSYGDYIFASSYRDIATEVSESVGQDNKRVWFIGDWGMQYYMRKNGYRYLTAKSNEPAKGDLIFIADKQKMWGPSPQLYERMDLIDIIEHGSWFPVRVMASDMRVGYYSHLWGLQPFTLSSEPVERFGVFRVVK